MLRFLTGLLAALALSACAIQPRSPIIHAPVDGAAAAPAAAPSAAPLAELVRAVDIPYETFTLANGLTTIVHTDRKTPIVGVTVYYRIGSRHEPRGRTGFAHLYEHLFFGGSESAPDFDKPLEAAGSTTTNGSTWYDRTNYVETVPKGALELALFMESDRMGHLLGAVTQDKLDKQRGVVQNEKRQGDNQPYGLADYAIGEGLFPVGHPYRHSTIGSMADLDAATLADVRQWFQDHYGPNNAVLALTGDIDMATARPLVEKWFGQIPRGPDVPKVEAAPVTLAAPAKREMADQVPVAWVTRNWSGPGYNDADTPALLIGMYILGGLSSSRLDNSLVRGEQLAVAVTASAQPFEKVSFLQAAMEVKPGVERATAEARFDQLVAQFVAEGPTEDEVRRAVTSTVSAEIGYLEEIGGFSGKGATLAEGQLYSGNPAKFREVLDRMAALTPPDVRGAMQRWLTRPAFTVAVVPGDRSESGETMGGWGDEAQAPPRQPDARKPDSRKPAPRLAAGPKRNAPPVTPVADLVFPALERAKLSNGIAVTLARRTAVPKLIVSLNFDAGYAADALARPGTQSLLMAMLDEGTASRDSTQIAEEQERLGASIGTGRGADDSYITLGALTANLAPSLALMADIARNPAFAEGEVARVKAQLRADFVQSVSEPEGLARHQLNKLTYGEHPYAQQARGMTDLESLDSLTAADLRKAQGEWLRPDAASIAVTGDIAMDRLRPLLEAAFGTWRAPPVARPVKDLSVPVPAPRARIVLIDRPDSPQSVIAGGRILPLQGRTPGMEALTLANDVLGGGFLSRLNLDLREDKGWSYGVRSSAGQPVGPRYLQVVAPVQADRTGDALRLILRIMKDFPAAKGVTAEELQRVTEGKIRAMPNSLESNSDVLSAILTNQRLGRPDDYYTTLASRLRAIDAAALDKAASDWLRPDDLVFVVVGEREIVEPQLKGLGLPVEIALNPYAGS